MGLRELSEEESKMHYQKNFGTLKKYSFFRVYCRNTKKKCIFRVTERIDDTTLEVVELTNPDNYDRSHTSEYKYNDNDCLNIIDT
jgi:hypothetical protein